MENNIIVGILKIVEDKLREFNIQIPDEQREDSTDPIVGYHYAELHDRIQEFLDESGLLPKAVQEPSIPVHVVSIVNSNGYANGNDSEVYVHSTTQDLVEQSYSLYEQIWEECTQAEVLEDGEKFLSKEAFAKDLIQYGNVCIQCYDSHVCFEYFKRDMGLCKEQPALSAPSLEAMIQSAESRCVGSGKNNEARGKGLDR